MFCFVVLGFELSSNSIQLFCQLYYIVETPTLFLLHNLTTLFNKWVFWQKIRKYIFFSQKWLQETNGTIRKCSSRALSNYKWSCRKSEIFGAISVCRPWWQKSPSVLEESRITIFRVRITWWQLANQMYCISFVYMYVYKFFSMEIWEWFSLGMTAP
jgi:hypothetical protein